MNSANSCDYHLYNYKLCQNLQQKVQKMDHFVAEDSYSETFVGEEPVTAICERRSDILLAHQNQHNVVVHNSINTVLYLTQCLKLQQYEAQTQNSSVKAQRMLDIKNVSCITGQAVILFYSGLEEEKA